MTYIPKCQDPITFQTYVKFLILLKLTVLSLSHPHSCLADVGTSKRTGYAILSGSRVESTPFALPSFSPSLPSPPPPHTRAPQSAFLPLTPSKLQERIRHTDVDVDADDATTLALARAACLDPLTSDRSKPFPYPLSPTYLSNRITNDSSFSRHFEF